MTPEIDKLILAAAYTSAMIECKDVDPRSALGRARAELEEALLPFSADLQRLRRGPRKADECVLQPASAWPFPVPR